MEVGRPRKHDCPDGDPVLSDQNPDNGGFLTEGFTGSQSVGQYDLPSEYRRDFQGRCSARFLEDGLEQQSQSQWRLEAMRPKGLKAPLEGRLLGLIV
jgi:hypothetical protein